MSRLLFQSLLRRYNHHHRRRIPTLRDPLPPNHSHYSLSSKPTFSNATFPKSIFLPKSIRKNHGIQNTTLSRFLSLKPTSNSDFSNNVFHKPVATVTSVLSRYSTVIGLQIEDFFRRNNLFLFGAAGVLICGILWKFMFFVADSFVGISEGLAKYGFLALSTAIVSFSGLYLRSRFTINPDKVYRMAMMKLNTSAGILEVMGAPLSGTDLRAYVMSGGGFTLKNFKPCIRSRRCFLIFPIRGSERKGLVNVEVKKNKGQYDMKLLAVDVPMASGPDQRLFLIGDEEEYRVGGGLISELREPVVRAMAAAKEFDDLDEIEEEEDAEIEHQKAERKCQEAERKHHEEIEKIENSGI
ncbi:PREDICTED: uncharacterized protein LOC109328543 [Lupinus angustifolius]|nr:PREDICTED: uncharacterized protein LOC109328543 [Lupinus angustifolius]